MKVERTEPHLAIDWRDLDDRGRGHGVEIHCHLDDGTWVMAAFIEGFEWRRGAARVDVHVLPDAAPRWAQLGANASEVRRQLRDVVNDVLAGASLSLRKGRFSVIANA